MLLSLSNPWPISAVHSRVNASNVGVGAILSQCSSINQNLQPCTFISRRLSAGKRYYGICNRELLARKLALEEWRHLFEGAEHPFLIWTDHNNLAYIQLAKRLNTRHAQWVLFFDHFNFTISHRLISSNIKPDTLSHQFITEGYSLNRTPIMTPSWWDIWIHIQRSPVLVTWPWYWSPWEIIFPWLS